MTQRLIGLFREYAGHNRSCGGLGDCDCGFIAARNEVDAMETAPADPFGVNAMEEIALCSVCGEPMPPGEEMFKFHGFSGPCPKPLKRSEEHVVPTFAHCNAINGCIAPDCGREYHPGDCAEYMDPKSAAAIHTVVKAAQDKFASPASAEEQNQMTPEQQRVASLEQYVVAACQPMIAGDLTDANCQRLALAVCKWREAIDSAPPAPAGLTEQAHALKAIKGLLAEAREKRGDIFHDTWNPDAHCELTLTIAELRGLSLLQEAIDRLSVSLADREAEVEQLKAWIEVAHHHDKCAVRDLANCNCGKRALARRKGGAS